MRVGFGSGLCYKDGSGFFLKSQICFFFLKVGSVSGYNLSRSATLDSIEYEGVTVSFFDFTFGSGLIWSDSISGGSQIRFSESPDPDSD